MLIKKETEYAVLSLAFLAKKNDDTFYDVKVLAKDLHLSETLIPKIFQKLAAADIVESKIGPGGGFRLIKNPKEISLLKIFNAVQVPSVLKCYSGKAAYCSGSDCPLHNTVLKIEKYLEEFLANTTLFEITNSNK